MRTQIEHFAVPTALPDADILKLCDLPAPFPGVANEYRPTLLIDLRLPEEDLWNGLTPPTRKMIRQAKRLDLVVEPVDLTEAIWNEFLAAYWKLWRRKSKAGALGVGQIRDLIAHGRFALTRSRDADGNVLSWHSYVRTADRVRLQTTISDMDTSKGAVWNGTVGRAHRLHHWEDMLRFKQQGINCYDMGGVYRGTEDQEQINIARFKQLFGGQFADTYDAVVPLTGKGRLALSIVSRISPERRAGGMHVGVAA